MTTRVYYDETARKSERWRVLRQTQPAPNGTPLGGGWLTIESFGTEKQAHAFAQGFTLGSQYAPPPEPIDDRLSEALRLVKLARDEYKEQCRELRAKMRSISDAAQKIAA